MPESVVPESVVPESEVPESVVPGPEVPESVVEGSVVLVPDELDAVTVLRSTQMPLTHSSPSRQMLPT